MAGSRGSTDRFVGRARELVRAESLLLDALAGHGRLVLCTGEAGIGKTRLAEELAASAVARGAVVVWARSTDPGSSQLPVFESLGMASDVAAKTYFATCDAAGFYVRKG